MGSSISKKRSLKGASKQETTQKPAEQPKAEVKPKLNTMPVEKPTKTTMKAAQINPETLKVEINEVPIPKPTASQVLIKVICASLCHSDIMIFDPTDGMQYPEKPTTMGHEATGAVVEVGSDVKGLEPGQVVGTNPATNVCYECHACKNVHNLWCENGKPVMQGFGADGFFAEYAVIDHHNALPLPAALDPVPAAPLFCAGVTAFHAVDDLKLPSESWVAIIGCGGLGLLGIQFAVAKGYKVIGIDTAKPALEEASSAGAVHIFDPSAKTEDGKTHTERIVEITGGGVDAAVNFTASKRAYDGMPGILRPGRSILMAVGIPPEPVNFSVFDIALGRYKIMGANNGQCYNTLPAVEFAAKHNIVSKVEYFQLEELPTMVDKMRNHTARGRMAVKF